MELTSDEWPVFENETKQILEGTEVNLFSLLLYLWTNNFEGKNKLKKSKPWSMVFSFFLLSKYLSTVKGNNHFAKYSNCFYNLCIWGEP